ncbi:MAG: hemolysin [Verrucomicrobia bacterium Tous-C9LFEB]|nr:MAG: hemolysin [Verrucomicrobia bacterium Tous-C9LFEB]
MTKTSTPPAHSAPILSTSVYTLRLATSLEDLHASQRLRYQVFNVELHEGLSSSESSGRDADKFDPYCDHLLVEHRSSGHIVGTYRLQTGMLALAQEGYYSAQEFFFAPYEPIRHELIEVGRACVHAAHRNLSVLHLLWRGIARYAQARNCRYLIGCSSLTTQDEAYGEAMYAELAASHLIREELQTAPLPGHGLRPVVEIPGDYPPLPRLMRAYLGIGAKICGRPAIDRAFKTIDFLTLLDLHDVPPAVRSHFLE